MIDPTDLTLSITVGQANILVVLLGTLAREAQRQGDGHGLLRVLGIDKRLRAALDAYQRQTDPPIAQVLGDIVPELLDALPKRKGKKG